MRASTIALLLVACGSPSAETPSAVSGSGAVSPGPTEEPGPPMMAAEPAAPLELSEVPAFLRATVSDVPDDASVRLGSRAFQLLDPGTSVQLTFREDRLEVLERVRGGLRVRNAATGETLETLSAGRGRITPATRSDDGSWIALGCGSVRFEGEGREFRLSSPNTPPPSELEGTGVMTARDHYLYRCAAFDANATTAIIAFEHFPAVQRVDLQSGEAETIEGVRCQPNAVAMAPSGERFACTARRAVTVVEGTEVREYAPEERERATALAFSADGSELAIGYEGEVRIVDASSLAVRARIRTRDARPKALAFSADGRWIATAAGGAIDVWDRRSGRPIPKGVGHGGSVMSVRLGDGVVFSSAETGEVLAWPMDRPTEPAELLPPAPFWRKLTRSADGSTLAAYWRDTERNEAAIQLLGVEGPRGPMHPAPRNAAQMDLSADGSFVAISWHVGVAHLPLGDERPHTLWRDGRADGRGVPLADGRIAVGRADSAATVEILPRGCAPDCEGRPLTTPEPQQQRANRRSALGRIAVESALTGGAMEDVLGGRRQRPPSANRPGPTEHVSGFADAVLAGDRIVTAARGRGIHVFDATSLERIGCWNARVRRLVAHSSGRVFALDSLGTLILLPADVPTPRGRHCTRLEATRWEGAHEGQGTDLDLAGDVIATAGSDGTIVLWSVETLLARENDDD